jgi:hypothetical protein
MLEGAVSAKVQLSPRRGPPKGRVCTGMSHTIARIATADVQTRMARDQLVCCRSTRRPATQWVFWKHETRKCSRDEIRGKLHIEIFVAAG